VGGLLRLVGEVRGGRGGAQEEVSIECVRLVVVSG
jgi:hypothetical protein